MTERVPTPTADDHRFADLAVSSPESEAAPPRKRRDRARVDAALRAIAGSQYGLVDVATARARGVAQTSIDRRVREGVLVRLHRGVHRFATATPSDRQRLAAARLAAGDGAVLIGRSAALLHGLAIPLSLEVGVPPSRFPAVPGVSIRRLMLAPDEIVSVLAIETTTLARTLLDLGSVLAFDRLSRLLDEALGRRLVDVSALTAMLDEHPRHAGSLPLRILVNDRPAGTAKHRSGFEARVGALLHAAKLGDGIPNHPVMDAESGRRFVDFAWPEALVALEVDSFRWHTGRRAWAADRHRANALTAMGWRIVVATDADIDDRLRKPIASLRALLSHA